MQEFLKSIIKSLGVAEKDVIEKNYYEKLQLWARLIDEVEAGLPYINDVSNSQGYFDQAKQQYKQLLDYISRLNIAQDASLVSQFQNHFRNFQQQYFERLVDLKQKIQAIAEDNTDVATLRRLLRDAKKQQAEFEKSFKDNLDKQASGSQKILATYFKKRLEELKADSNTSPEAWLQKRNMWFWWLLVIIAVFICSYIIIFSNQWLKGYELELTLVKAAVIALFYLQYHFATRNYNIYADLVVKYEHLAVISETMTDFTAAAFENEELNNVVYSNAAKTLFGEITTGHLKQSSSEPSIIENFINQLPKNS